MLLLARETSPFSNQRPITINRIVNHATTDRLWRVDNVNSGGDSVEIVTGCYLLRLGPDSAAKGELGQESLGKGQLDSNN